MTLKRRAPPWVLRFWVIVGWGMVLPWLVGLWVWLGLSPERRQPLSYFSPLSDGLADTAFGIALLMFESLVFAAPFIGYAFITRWTSKRLPEPRLLPAAIGGFVGLNLGTIWYFYQFWQYTTNLLLVYIAPWYLVIPGTVAAAIGWGVGLLIGQYLRDTQTEGPDRR